MGIGWIWIFFFIFMCVVYCFVGNVNNDVICQIKGCGKFIV